MLARIRKSLDENEEGFTLIELLVVIIIIGILAAIAIPVFLNQRKKAVDASIKSDLRTIANEMETNYVDTQAFTAAVPAAAKTTTGNTFVVTINAVGATDAFCIVGSAPAGKGTQSWVYESSLGGQQGTATSTAPTPCV